MARQGGKDRGTLFKDGKRWVRIYVNGQGRRYRRDPWC